MPVLGSGSIRFCRPVPPFKRIDVTTRIVGCDERWVYLEHKLMDGNITYSLDVLKAAFLDASGRIPTTRFLKEIAYSGAIPPMTGALELIRDADEALPEIAETSTRPASA